jgi:hypothetical protein
MCWPCLLLFINSAPEQERRYLQLATSPQGDLQTTYEAGLALPCASFMHTAAQLWTAAALSHLNVMSSTRTKAGLLPANRYVLANASSKARLHSTGEECSLCMRLHGI